MKRFLPLLILLVCVTAQAQTISVRNFGNGMTPVLTPYTNDPERIVYSLNFYSAQPGTRQLRFGYAPLITYAGADAPAEGVARLELFTPSHDSAAIVYAAGNRWYQVKVGIYDYGRRIWGVGDPWEVVDDTSILIRPFLTTTPASDSFTLYNTTPPAFKGWAGARFIQHLQVGDSVFFTAAAATARRAIKFIHSDDSLSLTGSTLGAYNDALYSDDTARIVVQRYYQPDSTRPYMHQAGDFLYTGSISTPPQVVFGHASSDTSEAMFIRPVGITDSMTIDTGYYNYADSITGDSRHELVSIGGTDVDMIRYFQIVDRSKSWLGDYFASSVRGDATSYYARISINDTAGLASTLPRTYRIVGNTDTSLILAVNFIDTSTVVSADIGDWPHVADTMRYVDYEGRQVYIFSAVGALRTVVDNDDTDSLLILNGGAYMFWPTGAATISEEDSLNAGMYWVHLKQAVSLPAVSAQAYRVVRKYFLDNADVGDPPITSTETIYKYTTQDVPWDTRYTYHQWFIYSSTANKQQTTLEDAFIKIVRLEDDTYGGDTLLVYTDGPVRMTDTAQQTPADSQWVTEWEIVESAMPRFAGMSEFNDRLMGYGDTLLPGMINMSRRMAHDDWTQVDEDGTALEFAVFPNPTDPVVAVLPYDNRAIIFRQHDMLDYPAFDELSMSNGLVGQRAVVGLNMYIYWLDVDGVYQMERRDFSGYSITKISGAIDPILNSWNTVTYGSFVVPIKINPALRHLSVMVHNQRDNHLYLFFPANANTTNSHCLTYDLAQEQWDGLFDIKASDAIWATFEDTSRILMGSPDSAWITKLDYAWNDPGGAGIDGTIQSGYFWLTNKRGYPVESRLDKVHFVARSLSGVLDTAYLQIIGETRTDEFALNAEFPPSYTQQGTVMDFGGSGNLSTYWYWKIVTEGSSSASIFQPYLMDMFFTQMRER